MREVFSLLLVAFLLSVFQACQDNTILKPTCRIFQIDLVEKWWYPEETYGGRFTKIFFTADGQVKMPLTNGDPNYTIENCNSIRVENPADISIDHWTIKRLTDKELVINYGRDYAVTYKRFH